MVTTAYFPPVEYFMAAAATGHLLIEDSESYVKQSYRNRCRIYACDGILSLTVPVSAPDGDRGIKSVRIDYSKPWLQQHERALVSAYRTSAFFEYYQDDVFAILESRPQTLSVGTQVPCLLHRRICPGVWSGCPGPAGSYTS